MVGFSGPIIDLIGFEAERMGDQADGVFFKMKLLIAAVPILAVIFQLWLLKKYPLNAQIAHDNRIELERRRGEINTTTE
jgi:Na+/melibiose symporter-like transporter